MSAEDSAKGSAAGRGEISSSIFSIYQVSNRRMDIKHLRSEHQKRVLFGGTARVNRHQ